MILKKVFVKKKMKRKFSNVTFPGDSKINDKRKTFIGRASVAASLRCMLVIGTVLTILVLKNNAKGSSSDLISNLKKIPLTNEVFTVNGDDRHTNPFKDESNIDTEGFSKLPVYKYINEADKEKILYSLLDYFSIDEASYDIKTKTFEYENGGSLLYCTISQNEKTEAEILVESNGRFCLKVHSVEESSINFGYTNPKNYVIDNNSLFTLDLGMISITSKKGQPMVLEKELKTELEKFLNYNNIGKYITFSPISDMIIIYYHTDEYTEYIGDYPVCTSAKAIEKYRKGNFICYNPQTSKLLECGSEYLDNSFEDEVLKTWLTYANDENGYIRPVYEIILQTKSGNKYFAIVDAIDDDLIQ